MQELLLARRVLHFHRDELMLECRTNVACQSGFLPEDPRARYRDIWLHNSPLGPRPIPRSNPYDDWESLVEAYTRRRLNYSDDRRNAVLGMVNVFAPRLNAKYSAGMWEGWLYEGLSWWLGEPLESRDLH